MTDRLIGNGRHGFPGDRRQQRPGARCPSCGEFVEERWASVVGGRLTYVCWGGHQWTDRRRPSAFPG